MTAIFHDIMHEEMEDYVDDIVVKSKTRIGHLQVLEPVFERCRKYKLCMNPMKCAFGVFTGNFLGFLVHHRGTNVDPAKAIAIVTMKRPTTVRELKSFLGRVSYIRRFVLGLASVTTGLSKLLKKGTEFTWGTEQQEAFQRIQQIMNHLPTLQAPVREQPLLLYLASNSHAIEALLAQEDDDGNELYYVCRTLKDVETRYPKIKKACLVIIYASQRLKRYFSAHQILLETKSHPIKALLHQPLLTGRIA